MKTTWLWIKKDLTQFRWWILGWVVLAMIPLGVDGLSRIMVGDLDSMVWGGIRTVVESILPMIQSLISLVFVPRLIQSDGWVGSRSFWMTRPISGAGLLTAKLLTLGIGWIAPVLFIHLIQSVYLGFGWGSIGVSVMELFLKNVSFILILAVVASMTSKFSQFAGWLVAGLIGGWIIGWFSQTIFLSLGLIKDMDLLRTMQWIQVSQENAEKILKALVELGMAGILLYLGYHARRLRVVWGIGIAGWACLILFSSQWKLDWFAVPVDSEKVQIHELKVELDPAQIKVEVSKSDSTGVPDDYEVHGLVSVIGGNRNVFMDPSCINLKCQVEGSPDTQKDGMGTPEFDPLSKLQIPHFGLLLNDLGEGSIFGDPKPHQKERRLLNLDEDEFGKMKEKKLRFYGNVEVTAKEYLKVAQIQIHSGKKWSGERDSIRILKSEHEQENGWEILLQESHLDLMTEPTQEVRFRFYPMAQSKRYWYALWNPEKRELLIPSGRSDDFEFSFFKERTTLSQKTLKLEFKGPAADWYEKAELVRWNERELGTVNLPFEVSGVVLEEKKP